VRIRLTKLSDGRHALEIERDGRRERVELETRSTLHHDLTHYAVEEAAGLDGGFFGALAGGASLGDLAVAAAEETEYSAARMEVERAVAVLQRLAKTDEDPAALHARVTELLAVQDAAPPEWFTVALVAAVRARLRELVGRWRATPYGAALELTWPEGPRR
jgi:hypothetical protein